MSACIHWENYMKAGKDAGLDLSGEKAFRFVNKNILGVNVNGWSYKPGFNPPPDPDSIDWADVANKIRAQTTDLGLKMLDRWLTARSKMLIFNKQEHLNFLKEFRSGPGILVSSYIPLSSSRLELKSDCV